jgi:L-aminopeptidase/D-esterase-like protein
MQNLTLTAVTGLRVGHASDPEAATGCTVVLGPFVGAVEVHGFATGSRELDALSPLHLVPRCDALLLTGGSAFGLAAADGVMRWLEERGEGFPTRAATVPIVPSAVIYDLGVGRADVRPDASMGYAAADAASQDVVKEGRHGVGTGASVGKLRGNEGAQAAGVGSWADVAADTVGALAVVNAFGDVLDERGEILVGARAEDGGFLDTAMRLRLGEEGPGFRASGAAENTTLGVVATDIELTKRELKIVARQATAALSRRISPAGTLFDGDIVFALSTGTRPRPTDDLGLMSVALRAERVLEAAIGRAVAADAGP